MTRLPLFLLFLLPNLAAGPDPVFVEKASGLHQKRPGGKDYALFFAVENYDSPNSWKSLPGLTDECRAMGRDLQDLYGFQPAEVVTNPSYQDILDKLQEYRSRKFNDDDQLFIYFSGHGQFSEDEGEGFFIPRDGKSSKTAAAERRWYSLLTMPRHVNKIGCRHIFLAIDACFSGTIDPLIALKDEDWATPTVNTDEKFNQYVHDLLRGQSRVLMTSGGKFRTKHPSDFTKWFRQAFGKLGGGDGILRPNEIEDFWPIDMSVRPQSGVFEGYEANGNFVFVYQPKSGSAKTPVVTAPKTNDDYDEDGIPDGTDKCPTERGPAATKGCPDSDLDGIADRFDDCPYEKGTAANNGCLKAAEPPPVVEERRTDGMVKIPGGTFKMGSDDGGGDEKPVHSVTVSDFYLGKYEVTVAEFRAFIDDDGYRTDAEKEGKSWGYDGTAWNEIAGRNWRHDPEGKNAQDNHPVINVSWNDATAYCAWLSKKMGKTYRLPTEAEWEYAAGNGSRHTKYSWGNGDPNGKKGGNVADESKSPTGSQWETKFDGYNDGYWSTAPVGSFDANDFGLHDMTGNVWEWCSDWKGDYPSSSQKDPSGPSTGVDRVLRGGSWFSNPQSCRVAYRDSVAPAFRSSVTGFRFARTN